MKQVLAILSIATFVFACSNVGKYADQINELASKWDSTTTAITDFATQVMNTQSSWQSDLANMQVSPEAMASWNDEMKTKYNEVMALANANTNNLQNMVSEVDGFMNQWKEKSEVMKNLKEGLASGKLPQDVEQQIAELTNLANTASTNLQSWQTKFSELNAAIANAKQMYADLNLPTSQPATR
ncbi:MAG: hypothetical protein KatS3mg029_0317 [Saprospiraceae bacterium]|nr:MAG: hypothetical protein KatS3mg029_0317 [Saprospiraceae bacterium]